MTAGDTLPACPIHAASYWFSNAVGDGGDVCYPHRRAVAVGNHDWVVLAPSEKLVVGVNREGLPWPVQRSFGLIYIGRAERGAYVFQAESVRR